MVNSTELPARKGYIETEIGGVRAYRKITTGRLYRLDEVIPAVSDPDADRDAMLLDMEYRLTMLEFGITE